MPKCVTCDKIFPPQFVKHIEKEAHKCIFCDLNLKEVEVPNGQDLMGKELPNKLYKKEQVVKDYEIFLKQLKEKTNIAKLLTKGELLNEHGEPIKR